MMCDILMQHYKRIHIKFFVAKAYVGRVGRASSLVHRNLNLNLNLNVFCSAAGLSVWR